MKQMFKCGNGDLLSLDDCMSISLVRPDEMQKNSEDEGVVYYAKVYISDMQNVSLDCYNIVREDYDRIIEEKPKRMFKCENGDMVSLDACISKSVLRPEVVQQRFKKEGTTYYAELYITDVEKRFLVRQNVTRKDCDRLSEVYVDPISGNHI